MEDAAFFADLEARHRRIWPAGLPTSPQYPHGEISLGETLRAWARIQPERPALIYYGSEITFAELDDLSERCAELLRGHGIGPGNRVAVLLGNCPQFHIVFYAILKLGAVYLPVNPLFKEHELAYELNNRPAWVRVPLSALLRILTAKV